MKRTVVYDEEIFKNLFLIVLKDVMGGEPIAFQLSPYRDDRKELMKYLSDVGLMIGFNNVTFDYPLLHFLIRMINRKMSTKEIVTRLNDEVLKIINADNRWSSKVRRPLIPQLDLMLINHYDNFAKATSLKVLEFNMRMKNVIEMPFPPGKFLTKEEINRVVDYCINDVEATYKFLQFNKEAIKFRRRFSKVYEHDFTNYNDVKIGEYILIDAIAKFSGKDVATVRTMRTERDSMKMSDIILPYIKFQQEPLRALLEWWRPKVITETKGQFTNLDMEEVQPLLLYCNNKTVKGKLKNLNVYLDDDLQLDFGTGGLHGDCGSWLFKSNAKDMIMHVDVSSYYPNLASQNGFHPAHIDAGIFKSIIDTLYAQRMEGKAVGDEQTVKAIKLALNGALYGKSNSKFSPMYDPMFMMNICVNGQLLLSMLAESIKAAGMKIIQVNTDGIFILLKRSSKSILDKLIAEWMSMTGLKLDSKEYNLIVQRDVNSYLAVDVNGKVKRKGAFEYEHEKNGDFHKDFSMLIVPKTLEAYYLHGTNPEDFIKSHTDMYDFFSRTKYDKTTRLEERWTENGKPCIRRLQNICRYYVSNDGRTFVKIMPPLKSMLNEREFLVEAGYLCTEANDINDDTLETMKQSINYDYYIDQVNKVIRKIQSND